VGELCAGPGTDRVVSWAARDRQAAAALWPGGSCGYLSFGKLKPPEGDRLLPPPWRRCRRRCCRRPNGHVLPALATEGDCGTCFCLISLASLCARRGRTGQRLLAGQRSMGDQRRLSSRAALVMLGCLALSISPAAAAFNRSGEFRMI